jgi:hypothetical protein
VQPGRREVDKALKQVRRSVKVARKATNQIAAKLLDKGNYSGAEALVARAMGLAAFQEEVEALSRRWRELVSGGGLGASEKLPHTALWEYYRPVLQTIVSLGGDTKLTAILRHLEPSAGSLWKEGDLAPGPAGRPRWKSMVKKCRRPMVKEGWLDSHPITSWRITEAGRRAASTAAAARARGA